jgi:hypothetical protein
VRPKASSHAPSLDPIAVSATDYGIFLRAPGYELGHTLLTSVLNEPDEPAAMRDGTTTSWNNRILVHARDRPHPRNAPRRRSARCARYISQGWRKERFSGGMRPTNVYGTRWRSPSRNKPSDRRCWRLRILSAALSQLLGQHRARLLKVSSRRRQPIQDKPTAPRAGRPQASAWGRWGQPPSVSSELCRRG